MSRRANILLIAAAAIVVVIVVGAVVAVALFPEDKVRTLIEARGTEALGMPVTVESVGISFWGLPAVSVSGIMVGEPREDEPQLARIGDVRVRVSLLALLGRRLKVTSLTINKPVVTVVTYADSTTNLPLPSPDAAESDEPAGPPALPIPVTLDRLRLNDGRIVMDAGRAGGMLIALDGIDVRLSLDVSRDLADVSSRGKIAVADAAAAFPDKPDTLRGVAASLEYALTGDLTTGDLTVDTGRLTLNDLPLTFTAGTTGWTVVHFSVKSENLDLRKAVRAIPAGMLPGGIAPDASGTVTLTASGVFDPKGVPALTFEGAFSLADGTFAYPGLPSRIDRLTVDTSFTHKLLTIKAAEVRIGDSTVSLSGSVRNYLDAPVLDVATKGTLDLKDITGAVPLPEGVKATGAVAFDITAQGDPSAPEKMTTGGFMELRDIVAELPVAFNHPLAMQGRLEFGVPIRLRELAVTSGESDFRVEGQLQNPFALAGLGDGRAVLDAALQSKVIDLDDLLVPSTMGLDTIKPWVYEESVKNLPIPPRLDGTMRLALNVVRFGRLQADGVKGTLGMSGASVTLRDLSAGAYGGTISGGGALDAADPDTITYNGNFSLSGLGAGDFLSALLGSQKFVTGAFSSNLSFKGAGLDSTSFLRNLLMNGDMLFRDGQVQNLDLVRGLGKSLEFLNFDAIAFDTIRNTFEVKDQRFITPDMALAVGFGDMRVNGWTAFDGKVDYKIVLDLNRETTGKAMKLLGGIASSLTSAPARLELTVAVGGTLKEPTVTLDRDAMNAYLKEQAGKALDRAIERNVSGAQADSLREKGKKLLNNLFKR